MKPCSKCKVSREFEDFYPRGDKKGDGFQSWCKFCVRAARALYVVKNKDKVRYSFLKIKFGVDQDKYNAMFASQGGCCAICRGHQTGIKKALCVDHDHKTGENRGLLCDNCNRGIGLLKDSQKILGQAISYLNKFSGSAGNSDMIEESIRKEG